MIKSARDLVNERVGSRNSLHIYSRGMPLPRLLHSASLLLDRIPSGQLDMFKSSDDKVRGRLVYKGKRIRGSDDATYSRSVEWDYVEGRDLGLNKVGDSIEVSVTSKNRNSATIVPK